MLGIYVLVQQIEGNVIIPVVMSRQVDLHPAVIVIGVVVVGQVIGFAGLLVAVPLISGTLILVRAIWVEPLARQDGRRQAPFDAKSGPSASTQTLGTSTPRRWTLPAGDP